MYHDEELPTDILSIFTPEVAKSVREYAHNSVASDLNITPHELQLLLNKDQSKKSTLSLPFFSRRLRQFA